ncbi:MAG TPA: HAMP domain-containing sensor histidine kinase [Gaiellaceae bacterium]|nr:HAMP domain-containing sensor histidine kinase [Gaiellaceae bacterium]
MSDVPAAYSEIEHESLDALVEAARLAALGELTAGAAHEINNPLFAILTLVDFLLRDAEPGTKAHDRLRLIEGSARDIEAVVGRVHRFARERAGDGAPFPLEEAAASAVDLVRHASAARDIEIAESYPPAPALVAGDPRQLKLIVVSLLLSAVHAVPGGGTVLVTVVREGDDVVASVAGGGPVVPAGDDETIFRLWGRSAPGGGAGLGLPVARALAELHGGTLAFDPAVAGEARFVLRLPGADA